MLSATRHTGSDAGAALAESTGMLIAMRALQGLGAALVLTLAGSAERVTHANGTGATVVYAWNQILQNTIPGASSCI